MEYVGEVVNPSEFKARVRKCAKEKKEHHYFMALKSDEIIDATLKGNMTRFVNHSCEPSCETQKVSSAFYQSIIILIIIINSGRSTVIFGSDFSL